VVILLGAEQGFAGAFNQRVFLAAAPLLREDGAELMILGSRATAAAQEHGWTPVWRAAMPARADGAATAADRLFDALGERLSAAGRRTAILVHARSGPGGELEIETRRLLPVDLSAVAQGAPPVQPLLMEPAPALLAKLAEEYVFARLCEAIVLSFGAESEARMRAMAGAHQHIDDMREALAGEARRVRQDEITSEIVDLAATALR
jgi:F-type H+-transporting ATPase subunit gamma